MPRTTSLSDTQSQTGGIGQLTASSLKVVGNTAQVNNPSIIIQLGTGKSVSIDTGAGAPTITRNQGSLYLRNDGGASTLIYVNTSGGSTWAAIASSTGTGFVTLDTTQTVTGFKTFTSASGIFIGVDNVNTNLGITLGTANGVGNNTQIGTNQLTIQGVNGNLLNIAEQNVAWRVAFDISGSLGLAGSLAAGGQISGIRSGGTTRTYVAPVYTSAGAIVAATTHAVQGTVNIAAVTTSLITLTNDAAFAATTSYTVHVSPDVLMGPTVLPSVQNVSATTFNIRNNHATLAANFQWRAEGT